MKNRLRSDFFNKPLELAEINRFFLACEFKPNSALWSVLDPFAYDVRPAFIYGKLGVISYKPNAYAITEIKSTEEPLLGYLVTITNPETILLLDKIKGYNGPEAYNTHVRQLTHAYTDINQVVTAWCYVLSDYVTNAYEEIQQIEFGLWADDKKQIDLLDKITKPD
jgi:hypothetical protein